LQEACHQAAHWAGIRKHITVHTLRHYAASRTMPRVVVRAAIHGHWNNGDAA
jgi:hypothetical protein